MNKGCENFRYMEKGKPWRDLTFKFYDDGKLTIIDNDADEVISPNDLRGDSMDFYVRRRLEYIKNKLTASIQKYA